MHRINFLKTCDKQIGTFTKCFKSFALFSLHHFSKCVNRSFKLILYQIDPIDVTFT